MKLELHCGRFVPLRNSKILHTVSWHTIKPGTPKYHGIAGYQGVKGSEFLQNLMSRLFSLGILMSLVFGISMSRLFVLWKNVLESKCRGLSPFFDVVVFWSWNHNVVGELSPFLDAIDYRILFIILICLCIHYEDSYCIYLDNWNILQQYNWNDFACLFLFSQLKKNEAVETHIPRHRDSKTKKLRDQDSKTKKPRYRESETKTPRHPETEAIKRWYRDPKTFFSEDKKPRHRYSKAEKSRHQDSKTKKPWHRVSLEFWPLRPLIW